MMRQLETAMGKDAFRNGIIEYIKIYADANADWNDLVEILDSKSPLDLKKCINVWVNQAGRPIFKDQITLDTNNNIIIFEISQEAEDGSDKIWSQSFDITLVYKDTSLIIPVNMTDKTINLTAAIGMKEPKSIIYNSNGYGYGVFPLDANQIDVIPKIENDVARAYSYINCYENTLNGVMTPFQAFNLFENGLKIEKNELIIKLISNEINSIFWIYFTPEQRNVYQNQLEDIVYQRLNSDLPSGIKKILFELFRSVAYSETGKEKLYQIWNKSTTIRNLKLNNDDYTQLATSLTIYQHEKSDEILESTKASISNPDKLKKFEFLLPSLSQEASVRDAFFESFKEVKNREKEAWVLIACNNIHHPLRQASAIKHLDMSLNLLEEIQRTGDIFFPKSWLNNTIGKYSSKEAYEVLERFLLSHPDYSPLLKKKIFQATDDLYRVQTMLEQ
jgi:aminopeptidase N